MTSLPAMKGNLPTRVGVPSNPALAFSQVVSEPCPSPVLVPVEVRCSQPVGVGIGVINSAPSTVGVPLEDSLTVTGVSSPIDAGVPSNPALAFTHVVSEDTPSPVVTPIPVLCSEAIDVNRVTSEEVIDPVVVPTDPVYCSEPMSINRPRRSSRRKHKHGRY